MVEAKLESLVQRLEAAVIRQEALAAGGGSSQPAAQASGPKMCQLAKDYVAAVSPALDALKAKTAELDNSYVTELVGNISQLAVMQVSVLNLMATFRRPADVQFLITASQQAAQAGEKMSKDMKSPINLVKVCIDATQLYLYPAFTDGESLKDSMQEFYD